MELVNICVLERKLLIMERLKLVLWLAIELKELSHKELVRLFFFVLDVGRWFGVNWRLSSRPFDLPFEWLFFRSLLLNGRFRNHLPVPDKFHFVPLFVFLNEGLMTCELLGNSGFLAGALVIVFRATFFGFSGSSGVWVGKSVWTILATFWIKTSVLVSSLCIAQMWSTEKFDTSSSTSRGSYFSSFDKNELFAILISGGAISTSGILWFSTIWCSGTSPPYLGKLS